MINFYEFDPSSHYYYIPLLLIIFLCVLLNDKPAKAIYCQWHDYLQQHQRSHHSQCHWDVFSIFNYITNELQYMWSHWPRIEYLVRMVCLFAFFFSSILARQYNKMLGLRICRVLLYALNEALNANKLQWCEWRIKIKWKSEFMWTWFMFMLLLRMSWRHRLWGYNAYKQRSLCLWNGTHLRI